MADLFVDPSFFQNNGGGPVQSYTGNPEIDRELATMPEEERQAALAEITAPPTGEEIADMVSRKQAAGEVPNMSIEDYRLYKAYIKDKEVDVMESIGMGAEMVFNDLQRAAGAAWDDPVNNLAKLTPSVIEAFAQGTRGLYGMLAQSQDPNSTLFRVKNALSADGSDEQAEFQQFMEALDFNAKSTRLMTGKETIVMDKDLINPEMTQAMSYIADPTLFIPFGGIAAKGARLVGMSEGLAKAAARAEAIKSMVLGGAIKWGVGAPIEFVGGATRSVIDGALERGSRLIEAGTGLSAKELESTARLSGLGTVASGVAGFPVAGVTDVSQAYIGATAARGLGEAIGAVGEQMMKGPRGVRSYAAQALRESAGNLTPHAQNLLKVIDTFDPMFSYSGDIISGVSQGAAIGAGLGYLSGGQEGMAQGIGAGGVLGGTGAALGRIVADTTGATRRERMRITDDLVLNGLKDTDPQKYKDFMTLKAIAETKGVDITGYIGGFDTLTPDLETYFRTVEDLKAEIRSRGFDPDGTEGVDFVPNTDLQFNTPKGKELLREQTVRNEVINSTASVVLNESSPQNKKLKAAGLTQDEIVRHVSKIQQEIKATIEDTRADRQARLKQEIASIEPQRDAAQKEAERLQALFNAEKDPVKKSELRQKLNQQAELVTKLNNKIADAQFAYSDDNVKNIYSESRKRLQQISNGDISWRKAEYEDFKSKVEKNPKLKAVLDELNRLLVENGVMSRDGSFEPQKTKGKAYDGSFVDENGRRLLSVEEFTRAEGFVVDKAKDGRVRLAINLTNLRNNTLPHEAFHAVFRSVLMQPEFQRRMTENVLGVFDKNGKMIEPPRVSKEDAVGFFNRYLKALYKGETLREKQDLLNQALTEYYRDGQTTVMDKDGKTPFLASMTEEFGAYYFTQFIKGKPVDYLYLGGQYTGIRGLIESAKEGWIDYWEAKTKQQNPRFDINNPDGIDYAFKPKGGKRVRVSALDYMMRDLIRAAESTNRDGSVNLNRMSQGSRESFARANGLDGVLGEKKGVFRRPSARGGVDSVKVYNKTYGKEVHKAILAMPDQLRPRVDGDGNFVGPLSKEVLDQMVSTGFVSREMANKISLLQDMASGKMDSNIAEMGYIGWSMQTDVGPNPPRVYGDEVPYKRRKVLVYAVESKIGPQGMSFTAKTVDFKVIEARANNLWADSNVRRRWNDNRTEFVQDFFRYLENASKTQEQGRVPSAQLWAEDGAAKRDIMQQMAGMPRQNGDTFAHAPIAEVHEDILNSVMNLTVNRMTDVRVSGDKVNLNFEQANPFIRVNMKVAEMDFEDTPNGRVYTDKQSGFKFTEEKGRITAYDRNGERIGTYSSKEEAQRLTMRVYERQQRAMKDMAQTLEQESQRGLTFKSRSDFIRDNSIILKDENIKAQFIKKLEEYAMGEAGFGIDEQTTKIANKHIEILKKEGFTKEIIDSEWFVPIVYNGEETAFRNILADETVKLQKQWEAQFPQTFRSGLLDKIKALHKQNPNLTHQGLLKKLLRDGSSGSRFWAEAEAIGLIKHLREQISPSTRIQKIRDAQGNWTGGIKEVAQPVGFKSAGVEKIVGGKLEPIDMVAIENFIKDNAITLTPEVGAREVSGMNTSEYTADGDKSSYNETAVRINREYAHGVRGHYGSDSVVHHRSTLRTDVNGEPVRFVEEIQANNASEQRITEEDVKTAKAKIEIIDFLFEEGKKQGILTELADFSTIQDFLYSSNLFRSEMLKEYGVDKEEASKLISQKLSSDFLLKHKTELDRLQKYYAFNNPQEAAGFVIEQMLYSMMQRQHESAKHAREGYQITRESTLALIDTTNMVGGFRESESMWSFVADLFMTPDVLRFRKRVNAVSEKVKNFETSLSDKIKQVAKKDSVSFIDDSFEAGYMVRNPDFFKLRKIENRITIQQFSVGQKKLPLEEISEWGAVAIKDIIRQATMNGEDKIALTHPDDTPAQVGMKPEARNADYGRIFPDIIRKIVEPFGIEVRVRNELGEVAKQSPDVVAATNAKIDAQRKVLELFEKHKEGESPDVINPLAQLLAQPVHEVAKDVQEWKRKTEQLIGQVNNRDLAQAIKVARYEASNEVSKYAYSLSSRIPASARLIDRAVSFELNDEIKKAVRQGDFFTAYKPSGDEGERRYTPEQLKNSFVGRIAQEKLAPWGRPLAEDVGILYTQDKATWHRQIILSDENGGEIGRISWDNAGYGDKKQMRRVTVNVNEGYQGMGYQDLLYSEAIERARFEGATRFHQSIQNKKGLPLRSQVKILGEDNSWIRDTVSDSDNPPSIPATMENFRKIFDDKITQREAKAGKYKPYVETHSKIDPKAWYKPEEGDAPNFEPNSNKASELLEQYLYGLKTGKSHQEMMTPELEYVFNNIEKFTKASNDDIVQSILRLGDKGEAIVNKLNNQEITLKQAVEEAKNVDEYTYLARLKDIRGNRSYIYKAFMRATGQMRKISDKDGRRYNTEGERESRNTSWKPSEGEGQPLRENFSPDVTPDWQTKRAQDARANQPMKLWEYPTTANFTKWAGKLKFIGSEEESTKSANYSKGFVTTVFKGVNARSFDRFSERSVVERNERSLKTDPNFFIADETAAQRYAGGGYFDVSGLNKEAQKVASRGNADMYYIRSSNPANLLSAHKLELTNPKLAEVVRKFWEQNIKTEGKDILDPQSNFDRFLLEISMGNWLSPRNGVTTISPFGQPWRMSNWVNFHEYLLKNGYDSVVIQDNSVSKKSPTIIVGQETSNVKASSNYGEFSKKDTRYNFKVDDEVKKNLRSLQSAIDRQADMDKVPKSIRAGVGRLIQAVERQRREDIKTVPENVKDGFRALARAVDEQADMDKVPAAVRQGLRKLFEAAQYEDLKPQRPMPKATASEEQLASGLEALGRAVGVQGKVRRSEPPVAQARPQQQAPVAQPKAPDVAPTAPRSVDQPSSSVWRSWTHEKTAEGSVYKSAVGYMIMVHKGKFKLYNPYNALVGIYTDIESAKRRMLRDEPKQ